MLKFELQKLFYNKLFFLAIIVVLGLWAFILNTTFIWSPHDIVMKSLSFWDKLGSLVVGFFILMINTRIFYMDIEAKVEEILHTTRLGKRKLFKTRLRAVIIFTIVVVMIFTGINLGLSFLFLRVPQAIITPFNIPVLFYYLLQTLVVILGGIFFTICTACICNSFKSHSITLIICGLLYGISYITRSSLVNKFSLLWFPEKGFFSYLIRGKVLTNHFWEIMFWLVWYSLLTCFLLMENKKIQVRRKEL